MAPVIPTPPHGEEALVPDHLRDDLKADPLQTRCYFAGMDSGMPDVADREGGHEFEGLGPVHASVAADGGVATLAAVGATGRRCGVIGAGWPSIRMYAFSAGPRALYTPSTASIIVAINFMVVAPCQTAGR